MEKVKKGVFSGAFILGIGTFIAKLLGAFYRVPLTRFLGGYGIGLYQMVFPVYTVLLDFSGAGIPNALAKIISSKDLPDRYKFAYGYLKTALKLLFFTGLFATLFMALCSRVLSKAQGDISATFPYIALSPSVFLVCLISCFRGYFQGLMKMTPTAVSQIIEQSVKLTVGLFFVYLLYPDINSAVSGAVFAITVSEGVALLYLCFTYKRFIRKNGLFFSFDKSDFKPYSINIVKYALPITLLGIMIPLSQVFDSFIIINKLLRYREDATGLYGLFSGVSLTVINLPVAVCYGIATVAVPTVSASRGKEKKRNAVKVLLLTAVISVPCAIACFFFSPLIVKILFGSLPVSEKETVTALIKLLSPCVFLLSFLQTENAVLIGNGNPVKPMVGLLFGTTVKAVSEIILVSYPELNVFGAGVSLIACYFIASMVNFIMIFSGKNSNENDGDKIGKFRTE